MKILKGVPLPPRSAPHREPKYPLHEMDVQDCIIVTVGDEDPQKVARRLSGAKAAYLRSPRYVEGQKFSVRRTQDENGNDAYGIWRVR